MDPLLYGDDSSHENREANEWIRFGMRLGVSAALHPFEYSKILIQLGFEPIPAYPSTSIFGKPIMALPNIFQYAGYIRKVDGFYGCYRGLIPKLLGSLVSTLGSEHIANQLGLMTQDETDKVDICDVELYIQFKMNLKRDIVLTITGTVFAQPFHVISIRMMSQFIGREAVYKNLLSSIKEIYISEGMSGFFSGLMPKMIAELACLILTSSTVYMVNKYFIRDKICRQYSAGITQFIFSSILYPLQVVATCMAVTGSHLMAGKPPIMPEYKNWVDCWNDLQARGELKRGSSLLRRSAVGVNKNATRRLDTPPLPIVSKFY